MRFPDTRATLIERLVADSDEKDWASFVEDYWAPICRFAARRGGLTAEDAEDVASLTFEVLLRNNLLARWLTQRAAKLRTLLCAVTRNILSNRARIAAGRERLRREHDGRLDGLVGLGVFISADVPDDQVDAFYAAWAESLVRQTVETLFADYHRSGRGDYFRVLYGRVCEGLSVAEIAGALGLKITDVENYSRHARKHLGEMLRQLVRQHVERYCPPAEVESEFNAEWEQLGTYLREHGGLEQTIRDAYEAGEPFSAEPARSAILTHLSAIRNGSKK